MGRHAPRPLGTGIRFSYGLQNEFPSWKAAMAVIAWSPPPVHGQHKHCEGPVCCVQGIKENSVLEFCSKTNLKSADWPQHLLHQLENCDACSGNPLNKSTQIHWESLLYSGQLPSLPVLFWFMGENCLGSVLLCKYLQAFHGGGLDYIILNVLMNANAILNFLLQCDEEVSLSQPT